MSEGEQENGRRAGRLPVRWSALLGHFIRLEIEVVCCITAGREVVWRVALEPVALVKCDGRAQHGGGLQHDAAEAQLGRSRESVLKQPTTPAAAAHLRSQIHLAEFAGGVGDTAEANRADNLTGAVHQQVERATACKVARLDVVEVSVRAARIGLEAMLGEGSKDKALNSGAIVIGCWSQEVVHCMESARQKAAARGGRALSRLLPEPMIRGKLFLSPMRDGGQAFHESRKSLQSQASAGHTRQQPTVREARVLAGGLNDQDGL